MKFPVLLSSILVVAFGAASAQEEGKSVEDLNLVEDKSSFQGTWVNPDADFTQFDKIYLWDGTFEYRDVGPARRTRSTMLHSRKREFGISEADRAKFQEEVEKALFLMRQTGVD